MQENNIVQEDCLLMHRRGLLEHELHHYPRELACRVELPPKVSLPILERDLGNHPEGHLIIEVNQRICLFLQAPTEPNRLQGAADSRLLVTQPSIEVHRLQRVASYMYPGGFLVLYAPDQPNRLQEVTGSPQKSSPKGLTILPAPDQPNQVQEVPGAMQEELP